MKCPNCGYEAPNDFKFCRNCGTPSSPAATAQPAPQAAAPAAPSSPAASRMLNTLKDPLFLVLCIAMSVATVFEIVSGSIPVLNILFCVFLWLAFYKAYTGAVDTPQLRNLSGTVYAQYVVNNVLLAILAVCGIVVMFFLMAIAGEIGAIEEALVEFLAFLEQELHIQLNLSFGVMEFIWNLLTTLGWLIGLLVTVICVVGLVFNRLITRRFHRFAQSVYKGLEDPTVAPALAGVKGWLMVIGVLNALSALGVVSTNGVSAMVSAGTAVATIVASLLVKKYFSSTQA